MRRDLQGDVLALLNFVLILYGPQQTYQYADIICSSKARRRCQIVGDRSLETISYHFRRENMNRRTFNKLAGFSALSALTDFDMSAEQAAAVSGEVILQDDEFLIAFGPASGALTRMKHKPTNWVVQRRPALGVSFRMLVPIPGRRSNFVLGQKQRAVSLRRISDNQVQIVWNDLTSEHGG